MLGEIRSAKWEDLRLKGIQGNVACTNSGQFDQSPMTRSSTGGFYFIMSNTKIKKKVETSKKKKELPFRALNREQCTTKS